jgi:hypothetical protein
MISHIGGVNHMSRYRNPKWFRNNAHSIYCSEHWIGLKHARSFHSNNHCIQLQCICVFKSWDPLHIYYCSNRLQ